MTKVHDIKVFIVPAGAMLAAICFLLPWVRFFVPGLLDRSVSGIDLLRGDAVFWIIFLAALLILLAFFYFNAQHQVWKARPLVIISSLVSIALLIFEYVRFSQPQNFLGLTIKATDIGFSLQLGTVGTFIGFLIALLGARYLGSQSISDRGTSDDQVKADSSPLDMSALIFSTSGAIRKELGIFILLIVLCVLVSIINPNFLQAINLQNLARQIGAFGIFSIGLGLVIITGGIDLSVGSMMALLGVLLSMMLTEKNFGVVLAVLGCFGVAMFLTFIHGLLITRVNMQPFIVTLCGLLFYRGLARFITKDETKGFGTVGGLDFLRFLANGNLFGIPMPFVVLILISIVTWVVLHRSVYGRYLFATGRNPEAARYAGVNTRWMITIAYVIAGALTAVSGIIFAFYTNSVSPANHGNAYELYGIAAAVLGGCSLRGGEGSVIGIIIGAALLQVLRNLVNLLGIPSSLDFAVMGAVILLGVMADQIFTERRNRRQVTLMRESARADMRSANPASADHSGGTGESK